jgi:hypothetical protein
LCQTVGRKALGNRGLGKTPSTKVNFMGIVIAVLLTTLLHPVVALDEWTEEWSAEAFLGFSAEQLAAYTDMATRHPEYFGRDHPHFRPPQVTWTGSVEQWRPLVAKYFAPQDVPTAMCIIQEESGGNPTAKNPYSSASGLFQHLARYWPARSTKAGVPGASIWDPEASTVVAAWLKRAGGWTHWTTWPLCR